MDELTLSRLRTALAEAQRERDEARFRPMGDNHHNAAKCPHCGDPLRAAEAARDSLRGALDVARKAIDRDRTGLAGGLAKVQRIVGGFMWLGAGEWGSYSWEERTEKTLRAEIAACLDQINVAAGLALNESGKLATETVRGIDRALLSASPDTTQDRDSKSAFREGVAPVPAAPTNKEEESK